MLSWIKWAAAPVAALGFILGTAVLTSRAEEGGGATGKGSIAVMVKDASGNPVADINVRVLAPKEGKAQLSVEPAQLAKKAEAEEGKKGKGKGKGAAAVAEGKTNAEGKATLSDIPAGKYDVVAMSKTAGRGKASATVEDGKTAEVTITLQEKGK